jgi:hypothetical protein
MLCRTILKVPPMMLREYPGERALQTRCRGIRETFADEWKKFG